MKFISWNVNGLRACEKKGFSGFFRGQDADFFCIQETKMQQAQNTIDFSGYYAYWCDAQKKGYSGTLTLARYEPVNVYYSIGNPEYEDSPGHDREGRFVILEYPGFFLINVYAPNSQRGLERLSYRMKWQDDLLGYLKGLAKPVIICGDLNVAHKEIDLKNPAGNHNNPGFTDGEREAMTGLLDAGFIDTYRYLYPDKTDAYTWWSYITNARDKNIGWRIDYFLVSECIKDRVTQAYIFPEVFGSDHCPVGADIEI